MPSWQDQKALDDELKIGAALARRWLELQLDLLAMTEDARHEFDRLLRRTAAAADDEVDASPIRDDRANTMGGPEPGVPVTGEADN